jgi:hypothetical protein
MSNIAGLTSSVNLDAAKGTLKNKIVGGVKQTLLNEATNLKNQLKDATSEHNKKLFELQKKKDRSEISEEKYNDLVQKENDAYNNQIQEIQKEINDNLDRQNKLSKTSIEAIDSKLKKSDTSLDTSLTNSSNHLKGLSSNTSNKLLGKVRMGAIGNPAPLILASLSIASQTISIKNKKTEALVDQVNDIINNIKTQNDVIQARLLRDNAVRIINDNEAKLENQKKLIERIQTLVKMLTIIINVLKVLLSLPLVPGKEAIRFAISKIDKILDALNIALPVVIGILQSLIDDLNEQKERLKQINDIFESGDGSTLFNNSGADNLQNLLSGLLPSNQIGMLDIEYKGFRFAVKEEYDLTKTVQGHKRHYAVAINRDGTPIIESSRSFTLNSDLLVDELKLIIDQRGLQA